MIDNFSSLITWFKDITSSLLSWFYDLSNVSKIMIFVVPLLVCGGIFVFFEYILPLFFHLPFFNLNRKLVAMSPKNTVGLRTYGQLIPRSPRVLKRMGAKDLKALSKRDLQKLSPSNVSVKDMKHVSVNNMKHISSKDLKYINTKDFKNISSKSLSPLKVAKYSSKDFKKISTRDLKGISTKFKVTTRLNPEVINSEARFLREQEAAKVKAAAKEEKRK